MAIRRRASLIGLTSLALLLAIVLAANSDRSVAAGGGGTGKEISVYENSQSATFLGAVRKMKCKVKQGSNGMRFHAGGRTTNGTYTLDITILRFKGFKKEYNVPYGVLTPTVDFEGITNPSDFSNVFPFPGGQPPPGAGSIAFSPSGGRVGLGIFALPNQDYSRGIALAGGAKCV